MDHKEVEIDGVKYFVLHPDPELAWEIGIELTKFIGEPISSFVKGGIDAIPDAVKSLLGKVDPKQSFGLIKKILSTTEVQASSKMMLDAGGIKNHFRGNMGALIKLVGEVLAFTHADFFASMKESIEKAMKKATESL